MENITKQIKDKLEGIQEHRSNIRKEYSGINKLEGDIIQLMIENDLKQIELGDKLYELMWIYDKKIDYDKLKELYPDIYELGLQSTFSKKLLYLTVDEEYADKIINECTTMSPHYELRSRKNNAK